VNDRSHTAHRLQTTLTPAQEAVAVALRKTLLVSLDDLLAVVRGFLNPDVSRSGLDRCLRRHGIGNLRDLKARVARPKHSGFKAYEPAYVQLLRYLRAAQAGIPLNQRHPEGVTEKSSPTGSLACASAHKAGNISSTSFARFWMSTSA
jgi:hypothetical protein